MKEVKYEDRKMESGRRASFILNRMRQVCRADPESQNTAEGSPSEMFHFFTV